MEKEKEKHFIHPDKILKAPEHFRKASFGGFVKEDVYDFVQLMSDKWALAYSILEQKGVRLLIDGDDEDGDIVFTNNIENQDAFVNSFMPKDDSYYNEVGEKLEMAQTEIEILKAQIEEYKSKQSNPASQNESYDYGKNGFESEQDDYDFDKSSELLSEKNEIIENLKAKLEEKDEFLRTSEEENFSLRSQLEEMNEKSSDSNENSNFDRIENSYIAQLEEKEDTIDALRYQLEEIQSSNNLMAKQIASFKMNEQRIDEQVEKNIPFDIEAETQKRFAEKLKEKNEVIEDYKNKSESLAIRESEFNERVREFNASMKVIDDKERRLISQKEEIEAEYDKKVNLLSKKESELNEKLHIIEQNKQMLSPKFVEEMNSKKKEIDDTQQAMQELLILAKGQASQIEKTAKEKATLLEQNAREEAENIMLAARDIKVQSEEDRVEILSKAQIESDEKIKNAENEAEIIINKALEEKQKIEKEIEFLVGERRNAEYNLKQILQGIEMIVYRNQENE